GYPTRGASRTLYGGASVAVDVGWWPPKIFAHVLLRIQEYSHGSGDTNFCESSEGTLVDVSVGPRTQLYGGSRLNFYVLPTLGLAVMSIHGTAGCSGQDGVRIAPILTGGLGLDIYITSWAALRIEGRTGFFARDIDIGGRIQSLELSGAASFVLLRH